ncbi:uncharacterized protein EDB93DRAFT_1328976 [Suillus bovinus]|uniref:uncharacterized protein n=1 Tax=Suillus bovinus TaxID=48563 RepID=UPI001B886B62|nr:uncharacterized protein EDB93DRAFT_1328976 [Suillus bovinus]KAG2145997.1 hypothetical protein EDB93DRAFT_1328976 [Suillus bovinus]
MVLERFPYDVLRHIFSFLQQCHLDTLSALARTSHSIHEPAVDLLWENQQTLWPLVLLLPSSVIERASLGNQRLSSWVTFLARAPRCPTWDRVLYYGSRIRRVCFSVFFRMTYYKLLAECPSPLLPNLAHLEFHAYHEIKSDLLSCLQLLVEGSQGLQSLTVKYCPRGIPASVLNVALACLTAKCSMLEQVHISFVLCCHFTSGLYAPVFSNGQNYTFLKAVDMLSEHKPWITQHPRLTVSAEIVRELGRMPCLEEAGFSLVLGPDEPFEIISRGFVSDNPYARRFGTLKKLRLRTATVKHTTAILKIIGSHLMEDLMLWVDGPVSVPAFYSIAELLSSNRTDEDRLKFINIKNFKFIAERFFSDPFKPVPLSHGAPASMISPLFTLHALHNFKIDVMDTVAAGHAIGGLMPALCRDDLETIPQAWKDIEELELHWLRSGTETDTRIDDDGETWESEGPTLAEVALLASRCEKLSSLGIWFNAQDWFDDDPKMDSNGEVVEAEDLITSYENQERRVNTQVSSRAAATSRHLDHSNEGPSSSTLRQLWVGLSLVSVAASWRVSSFAHNRFPHVAGFGWDYARALSTLGGWETQKWKLVNDTFFAMYPRQRFI